MLYKHLYNSLRGCTILCENIFTLQKHSIIKLLYNISQRVSGSHYWFKVYGAFCRIGDLGLLMDLELWRVCHQRGYPGWHWGLMLESINRNYYKNAVN